MILSNKITKRWGLESDELVWVWALVLNCYVILGKLVRLSETPFIHLYNGGDYNNSYLKKLRWGSIQEVYRSTQEGSYWMQIVASLIL